MTSFLSQRLLAMVSCSVPAFLFLASCKKEKVVEFVPAETQSIEPFFTKTAPADPQPISAVRTTAKPGEQVTVSGLVMGREKPFVDGRAAFVLGDPSKMTPCNKMPGEDHCKTPWDACCDTPEAKREGSATIQLVGVDQRVIKRSLKGEYGLKELSSVTLTGTVDKASTPEALIINATALHVTE
ncbi:hypothetical protein OVA24_02755 [Luteolibacter sp. SL250]|uniref:hypothetical protein n=1 Tax=Luteolibacter sp. SL250 TaxID=2995170 RepID=UPI00226D6066|nr:hypothetical protein [Luteolibacter sp. SL250]WAC20298.1 hypothetical protein OVA24_02755 [Luteolibacter sp. SL250]